MNSIHQQLEQKTVIENEQIYKLKEEIGRQYKHLPPEQTARILAKRIHEILDDSLPTFSKEMKAKLRMALLQQHVSSDSLQINSADIVSLSMDFVGLEELEKKLPQWISEQVEAEGEKIETYIEELRLEKQVEEIAVALDEPPRTKKVLSPLFIAVLTFFLAGAGIVMLLMPEEAQDREVMEEPKVEVAEMPTMRSENELPDSLQFQAIHEDNLKTWLDGRNSLLAEEPYFSTIIRVADEFNIHPLLLFAITGQEQGFVPKDHDSATKIANNPFNVFHSWEDFNTDIEESTEIAARTIVNLSEGRPEDVDPIQWINRKYAEDPNWWKGVSAIFRQLEGELVETNKLGAHHS